MGPTTTHTTTTLAPPARDADWELNACSTHNPQVQELESGHIWWYQAESLESVAEAQVPERLRQHPTPGEGVGLLGFRPASLSSSNSSRGVIQGHRQSLFGPSTSSTGPHGAAVRLVLACRTAQGS
jgi:hypothetical protein